MARMQRIAYARFYLRPSRVRRLFEMAPPGVYLKYLRGALREWWTRGRAARTA